MVFKGDVNVSLHMDGYARRGSAKVDFAGPSDPVQQFTYSALAPSVLKGDIQTVFLTYRFPDSRF